MAAGKRILPRVIEFLLVIALASAGLPAFAQEVHSFDVSSADAATAIHEFGAQSGVQILAAAENLRGKRLNDVSGEHSTDEALGLLLAGSGLEHRYVGDQAVALVSAQQPGAVRTEGGDGGGPARAEARPENSPASTDPDADAAPPEPAPPQTSSPTSGRNVDLEEIIVTGTHIRGGSMASPVMSFDREVIERSGFSTTQQLVQSLPQNLNNFSDTTFGEINGGAPGGIGQGSGPNLRGLGGDSTLVLLNGRRLAPAGQGNYVDVSLIPLSAVESIEVLTDGASAIYGSDAVAGVINVILREQVDGAETRLRYGTATQGGTDEYQVGQSLGHSWSSGSALLSYEIFDRERLRAADRDFIDLPAAGVLEALTLSPEQERQGILLSVSQDITEQIELSADVLAGRRESDLSYQVAGLPVIPQHSEGKQFSGSVGATIALSDGWQMRAAGSFSRNETLQESVVPQVIDSRFRGRTRVWSLDIGADGAVGRVPAGEARLALGGQYREEQSRDTLASPGGVAELDRDAIAAYAELLVPVVNDEMGFPVARRIDLTAAVRFENYSDFGSTTNPKLGLSWSPVAALNIRATYGRSFKAPLLSELNPASTQPVAYLLIDPASAAGFTPGLVLFGGGRDLEPETATTWTAGFDLTPAALPELTLEATWFEIDFEERIASPLPSDAQLFSVLTDPAVAEFIDSSPDPALVADYFLSPSFLNIAGVQPADIGAIADGRVINIAESVVRGVDVSASWGAELPIGGLNLGILANYLFEHSDRVLPEKPATDFVDTVYHQPDLRLRANVSLNVGALTTTAFVNYTDGYADNRAAVLAGPDQRPSVRSWTTFDATAIWEVGDVFDGDWSDGTTLTFSALNVFDRDPPFVASTLGIYFDGVNASPMGRWVSLRLTKRW